MGHGVELPESYNLSFCSDRDPVAVLLHHLVEPRENRSFHIRVRKLHKHLMDENIS